LPQLPPTGVFGMLCENKRSPADARTIPEVSNLTTVSQPDPCKSSLFYEIHHLCRRSKRRSNKARNAVSRVHCLIPPNLPTSTYTRHAIHSTLASANSCSSIVLLLRIPFTPSLCICRLSLSHPCFLFVLLFDSVEALRGHRDFAKHPLPVHLPQPNLASRTSIHIDPLLAAFHLIESFKLVLLLLRGHTRLSRSQISLQKSDCHNHVLQPLLHILNTIEQLCPSWQPRLASGLYTNSPQCSTYRIYITSAIPARGEHKSRGQHLGHFHQHWT